MKRVLSVLLALSLILTMFSVSVLAEEAQEQNTVIYEDFGDNFAIDSTAGTVTTNSGFTVTTGANMFTSGVTVLSKSNEALYINARQDGVSYVDTSFGFDKVSEGQVYIGVNVRMPAWGYSNFMTGQPFLHIKNSSGSAVASLYLDGRAKSSASGYYLKTANSKSYAEDDYTIGTFVKNGVGMSSYAKIEYIFDFEDGTYRVLFNGTAKEFAFSGTDVAGIMFPNNHKDGKYYNKNYMIDDLSVIINKGSKEKAVNFYKNGELYDTQTVEFGNSAEFPAITAPEGTYFTGWFGDANGETAVDLSMVMEDMNVYAIFKPTTISEDFGDGFVIDSTAGTVTTNSGFTVTTGANMFTSGVTVLSKSNEALYINARQDGVSYVDTSFSFGKISEGKVYLGFNVRMPAWGYSNFMTGQPFLHIKNSSGSAVASLYLDGRAKSSASGYYLKTANSKSYAEDDYTIGTFVKNGVGMSSYAKIEYIFDLDNGTYRVLFNGTAKEFAHTATDIAGITFPNNHQDGNSYNKNYIIDDLNVIVNTENTEQTVNFYKNGELYESKTVNFGEGVDFPVLEAPEGTYFSGWYGDAKGETSVDLSVIKEDTNAYAIFKPYVIHEDFGRTTSFKIDTENKTIKTDSGFTFTASDEQYAVMSLQDGILKTEGRNNATANTLTIGFDPITEGEAELSFRFAILIHNSNGNPAQFGAISGNDEKLMVGSKKIGFGTVTNHINETTAPSTLSTDWAWHTVTYKLNLDEGTYYLVFDDASYGPYTLKNTSVSNIAFNVINNAESNYNYKLSDVVLILDPENNIKEHMVTYVNGSETVTSETVSTGAAATTDIDLSVGNNIFSGWYADEECTKPASLDAITKDMTVYAGYVTKTPYEIPYEVKITDKESGTVYSDLSEAAGKAVIISVPVEFAEDTPNDLKGILSLFDQSGNVIEAIIEDVTASDTSIEFKLTLPENVCEIKVMYWNSMTGIMPLNENSVLHEDMADISMISFNIRSASLGDEGVRAWENRKTALVDYVNSSNADIICMQEVTNAQYRFLKGQLDPKYEIVYYQRTSGGEGQLTAYNKHIFEKVADGRFWLSETPDVEESISWGALYARISVWASLKHKETGGIFNVHNIHLSNESETARTESIKLINAYIEQTGYPAAIIGDYNADNTAETYTTAATYMQDCKEVAPITDSGRTYSGWGAYDPTTGLAIDHIFVSKETVKPLEYKILRDMWGENNENGYSDHYAIRATVKVDFSK